MSIPSRLLLFSIILCAACSSPGADNKPLEATRLESKSVETTSSSIAPASEPDKSSNTTSDLLELAAIVDSFGFGPDTNKIKKVGYYSATVETSPIFLYKQIPFYKMDTSTNRVFSFLKQGTPNGRSKAVDNILQQGRLKQGMSKVTNITGFYFTEKKPSELTTDGFIEKWEFKDSIAAETAFKRLTDRDGGASAPYYFIYFNSYAQIFKKDNNVYTYYSRSTWDAKLLDTIYEKMIKKIKPEIRTTSQGQTKRRNAT